MILRSCRCEEAISRRSDLIITEAFQANVRLLRLRLATTGALLQKPRRPDDRAPHVGDRTVVETKALFRLLEMAADDILELFELDDDVRVEGVDVVHCDQARCA